MAPPLGINAIFSIGTETRSQTRGGTPSFRVEYFFPAYEATLVRHDKVTESPSHVGMISQVHPLHIHLYVEEKKRVSVR